MRAALLALVLLLAPTACASDPKALREQGSPRSSSAQREIPEAGGGGGGGGSM